MAATIGASLLVLLGGCSDRLCEPALSPSGDYTVHLLDAYDASSRFTFDPALAIHDAGVNHGCAGLDGLAAGMSVEVRGIGRRSDRNHTCDFVEAELASPPAALTVVGPTTNQGALDFALGTEGLFVAADVTLPTCSGTMVIELASGHAAGGILSAAVDGASPPAILYRLFLPSTSACGACEDNFTASVTKN